MTCWSTIRGRLTHQLLLDRANASYCSHEHDRQIVRIFEKLVETIKNPNASSEKIDRALEAMELIVLLSETDIAHRCYNLFHVVMQTPLTDAYTEGKKWNAARFTMHGAYKWTYYPRIQEPQ